MSDIDLTAKIYTNKDAARRHLEKVQWPDGPVCPHCGSVDNAAKLKGKSTRPGVYKCRDCRKPFSVTVGTLFERSHVPLNKWLLAMALMTASKKGISAHQLHRQLGVTYKTAWFMAHRIREAMREENMPLGGDGQDVEADETYFGNVEAPRKVRKDGKPFAMDNPAKQPRPGYGGRGPANKRVVLGLVERGGRVKTFHVEAASKAIVGDIVRKNVRRESRLQTDEANVYVKLGREFKGGHERVRHARNEYVRGTAHTNSIEGYWSVFKRGMKGVYQHCAEKHLHRYLAEFDFRYNRRTKLGWSDAERAEDALRRIAGKRLTYRRTSEAANA